MHCCCSKYVATALFVKQASWVGRATQGARTKFPQPAAYVRIARQRWVEGYLWSRCALPTLRSSRRIIHACLSKREPRALVIPPHAVAVCLPFGFSDPSSRCALRGSRSWARSCPVGSWNIRRPNSGAIDRMWSKMSDCAPSYTAQRVSLMCVQICSGSRVAGLEVAHQRGEIPVHQWMVLQVLDDVSALTPAVARHGT
jgi:hypothetical protein